MEVVGMNNFAKWIKPRREFGDICPVYLREFCVENLADGINDGADFAASGELQAKLTITAFGCYEARLNGRRVGDYVLAPSWTEAAIFPAKAKRNRGRLQVQEYDVSLLIEENNSLEITVGRGWYRSPLAGRREEEGRDPRLDMPPALTARLEIFFKNRLIIMETDEKWLVAESPVIFSEIYDGETYDATQERHIADKYEPVEICPAPPVDIVPQQGEEIREMDRLAPAAVFTSPKGEKIIDFGQNITGYIKFALPENTPGGAKITFQFAEVLDADGNFYTENLRTAKAQLCYICKEGVLCRGETQEYTPKFTFFGFRYVKVETDVDVAFEKITAVAVFSQMRRTGWLASSNANLNRFFENVIWGQKGNFLDVPTDCPQRDERLGWTGDAQVFVKTAALNYDVEKFFAKWLEDLAIAQLANGLVPHVVPDTQQGRGGSAAWGDAATICPWEIYLAYGNKKILEAQFESMCKWVDFMTAGAAEYIWDSGTHFGDWLSLELPCPTIQPDARRGATRHDLLATAFFAHSVGIVAKTAAVLGREYSQYETLRDRIIAAFRQKFPENDFRTQTEYVLALHFDLAENPQAVADALAEKIKADGSCLMTGFVGTPYILHVLSRYGYTRLAYDLLLREEYPSWLYPVTKGATTIWERWDSIKPDGSFQTANMNSFNHYAYGAAADWVYTVAAGICVLEDYPGYARVKIAPQPDPRLQWLSARLDTRHGTIFSKWEHMSEFTRYEIIVPVSAQICIGDKIHEVGKGAYTFYEPR